jgi:hypothetical protein
MVKHKFAFHHVANTGRSWSANGRQEDPIVYRHPLTEIHTVMTSFAQGSTFGVQVFNIFFFFEFLEVSIKRVLEVSLSPAGLGRAV